MRAPSSAVADAMPAAGVPVAGVPAPAVVAGIEPAGELGDCGEQALKPPASNSIDNTVRGHMW